MERTLDYARQNDGAPRTASRDRQTLPDVSASHPMLQLQQHAGNQAVQQLLRAGAIRAKLAVSNPGDPEEREADAVADRVMRSPDPHAAGGICPCMLSGGELCDSCKQKQAAIQRKATRVDTPGEAPQIVNTVLKSPGQPLDVRTRSFFEPRLGTDLSHVRVHSDSSAAASARSINALAYTAGNHLVFGQGQYAPQSPSGAHLLAHELTHVLQQSGAGPIREATRLPIDTSGEANARQVTTNVAAGRPPGSIDFKPGPRVQRQVFGAAEQIGDLGKIGELGKVGELGKTSPPEFPFPRGVPANDNALPRGVPANDYGLPRGTPANDNALPKTGPGVGPLPVPPVVPLPLPQPQPDPDEDRSKDPKCGTKELPLTMVTFFPGPLGQGGRVKASPLTKCPGNTRGSQPDRSIYRQEFDCIAAAGQSGSWVRAHLLHGETSSSGPFNLHGPGNDIRNLIITDKSINSLMSSRAERAVIDAVYARNAVMWYDSVVNSYEPGKESFAQAVTVTTGFYNPLTNTEGPPIPGVGGTFRLKRTPPNCPPPSAVPTPAQPTSIQGMTPPVVPGTTAGTPNTNLEFQSTFKVCLKELASRPFQVKNGGLEVRLFGEWFDAAGEVKLDASACPIDHYFVVLEQSGVLWGFNQYSEKPIRIPIGTAIQPLKWKGLKDDTYRLKIYVEGDHPSCCLQGDLTVATFDAPAGGEIMA